MGAEGRITFAGCWTWREVGAYDQLQPPPWIIQRTVNMHSVYALYICTLYMHSLYALCICTLYKCTKNTHSVYAPCICTLYICSARQSPTNPSSSLQDTALVFCVGNCTHYNAIIALEWFLCITFSMDCEVLHCFAIIFFTTLQEKDFVFSAMQLAPEWRNVYATFTFMYIVYVCWSFLCLSWPNCEKLCLISLGGEWGESNSMWPCQCRE